MSELSPDEAARALELARTTQERSRHAVREAPTTVLLLYWGLAWLVLYAGHAVLRGGWGDTVLVVLLALPVAWCGVRWRRGTARLVSGRERQLLAAWGVLVGISCLLPAIARPISPAASGLLIGALWGLALLLYALFVGDWVLLWLGGGIVALAWLLSGHGAAALPIFGVGAGGGMAVIGAIRLWRWRQTNAR